MNNISNIIYDSLQSDSPRWKADSSLALYALAGLSLIPIFQSIKGSFSGVKAQVVGHRSFFEPQWLVRHRFIKGSAGIIQHGYDKVQHLLTPAWAKVVPWVTDIFVALVQRVHVQDSPSGW